MPRAKKAKKHIPVKRHWRQDDETVRKNVIKSIRKGRKAGLTWNEICQDIYDKGDIYISPAALQQRWTYYKNKGDIYISPAALQQRWTYYKNKNEEVDKKEQTKEKIKKYLKMSKKKLLKICTPDLKKVGDKIVGLAPDIEAEKAVQDANKLVPHTPDHFALAKMIESMIEDKVAAVLVNVKVKVNELDEQFTKAFSGIIKLEKVIKALRNEVNSYGK